METGVRMDDYWTECGELPSLQVEEECGTRSCDEGEPEKEWLQDMGLHKLAEPYLQGQEVDPKLVDELCQVFSPQQAEAVKKRVSTLNKTARNRRKTKHRKADVRDVFKGVETNGTHSRSATPDSLDSGDLLEPTNGPPFTTTIKVEGEHTDLSHLRKPLERAPSAPLSQLVTSKPLLIPHQSIFRHYMPDVAGSDGPCLTRYQYVGTLPRHRSGSHPNCADVSEQEDDKLKPITSSRLSRSHGNLLDMSDIDNDASNDEGDVTWIDSLLLDDIERLKPLVLAEATAIFDKHAKHPIQRKPLKSHRKIEGNVFGISLAALLEKDERYLKDESNEHPFVPLIIQTLVNHLEQNFLKEEGLLRVAGGKGRIDNLTGRIENDFYRDKKAFEGLLFNVSPHDVAAALKKLFRELSEPVLTFKHVVSFYHVHEIVNETIRQQALNLLILLLPVEHQASLRYLFRFLIKLSQFEVENKMNLSSIATILAPSLFPPRYITSSKEDVISQVALAERCIELSELLLRIGDSLWLVPPKLIRQLRTRNQMRIKKENSKPRRISYDNKIMVDASQLGLSSYPIWLTDDMTARDAVLRITNDVLKAQDGKFMEQYFAPLRNRMKPRNELTPGGFSPSCFLTCASNETALQTHFLCERGGNLVQRKLQHTALIRPILRVNPNAGWKIECKHRKRLTMTTATTALPTLQ